MIEINSYTEAQKGVDPDGENIRALLTQARRATDFGML